MFGGKFWRCLNPEDGEIVSYEEAANKYECIERNLTWANPQINFDNVLNAYLALFQVVSDCPYRRALVARRGSPSPLQH